MDREATVKTLHGKLTGSKLGKEYNKAIYCHSIYLTYVQSACVHVQLIHSCLTPCHPMDCSPQTPLFMNFSRQEY